jgi:hypothetical protein
MELNAEAEKSIDIELRDLWCPVHHLAKPLMASVSERHEGVTGHHEVVS